MKRYQTIVFFDMDGTLLDEHSKTTDEILGILEELRHRQVLPVVATGRAPWEIDEIMAGSGIDSYVSLNGQYVICEGQVIYEHKIPESTIAELLLLAEEKGQHLGFYSSYNSAVSGVDQTVESLFAMDHLTVPPVDKQFFREYPVYLMGLFSEAGIDVYQEQFAGRLSFVRDSPYSYAVTPWQASKKTGIEVFLNHTGRTGVHTYAFGDGNNDLEMFDAVDVSIAMGNAVAALKEKADYVTASNTEHGIGQGLRHYHLLSDD